MTPYFFSPNCEQKNRIFSDLKNRYGIDKSEELEKRVNQYLSKINVAIMQLVEYAHLTVQKELTISGSLLCSEQVYLFTIFEEYVKSYTGQFYPRVDFIFGSKVKSSYFFERAISYRELTIKMPEVYSTLFTTGLSCEQLCHHVKGSLVASR